MKKKTGFAALIEAFQILNRYVPDGGESRVIETVDDEIFINGVHSGGLDLVDLERLNELGFSHDRSNGDIIYEGHNE